MKNRLNVSKGVIAILLVLYQSRRENPQVDPIIRTAVRLK